MVLSQKVVSVNEYEIWPATVKRGDEWTTNKKREGGTDHQKEPV